MLPSPLKQRLTTQVIAARSALEVLSGLSILHHEDGLHDQVAQVLERTRNNYRHAIQAIQALGEGAEDALVEGLVEWLQETGEKVEGEWNGETEAGTFAASIAEGTLGEGSPEAENLQVALFLTLSLSLQWDSNPASAAT